MVLDKIYQNSNTIWDAYHLFFYYKYAILADFKGLL